MEFLRRLGQRIRSRRKYLGRTRVLVAQGAEISTTQLAMYESGQGHPPAATLHRIAAVLGISSSALMGETQADDGIEMTNEFMALYTHPQVGSVIRYMQDMTPDKRKTLVGIAAGFVSSDKKIPETVEVML
jgi:transcriptional regulator with XRE-family HTH domain